MRLKLNRTLRAALIAAVTAVGFTLSQAQAATTEATTLTTTFGNCNQQTATSVTTTNVFGNTHVATIPGATITSLTQHTSDATTVNLQKDGAAGSDATFFSPNNNVGNAQSWKLTMTYNNAGDIQSITGMSLSVGLFNNQGAWQTPQAEWNNGNETFTVTVTAGELSQQYTGVLFAEGQSHKGQGSDKFAVTLTGAELDLSQANTFTVVVDLPNNTMGGGCFMGLQNVGFNVTATVPEIVTSTWQGTDEHYTWSDEDAWVNAPGQNATVVFDGSVSTHGMTVNAVASADSVEVKGSVFTFTLDNSLTTGSLDIAANSGLQLSGNGVMEVTGTATIASGSILQVNGGATLKLHDAATAAQLLQTVTGAGNITLAANTELAGVTDQAHPVKTQATGTLTIDNCELKLGKMDTSGAFVNYYVDMSSFNGINLNNGKLWIHSAPSTLKNLTVSGTSTIHIQDQNDAQGTQYLTLAGTTTVNTNSKLIFTGTWKAQSGIELLAGEGSLELNGPNPGIVNIGGGSIGLISVVNNNSTANITNDLELGGLTGTQGTVNAAKNLTFTGAGTYSYTGTLAVGGQIIKTGAGTQTISGTALYHTILAQGGTLVLTGTYDISGIAPSTDPTYVNGDSPYIASGNGFKHTEGKVHVVNIAGGNLSADTATFTYGSEQRTGLDEEGYFTLSGSTDYSVLYVNNNGGVSYNAAWNVAQAQSTNITSVVMADGVTTLTADKEDASFTLAITGTGTVNATKDATVTALTGTGKLIVGGEKTVTAQSISGYSGEYEVAEGAMLQIVTNNAPASLTVDGNGALRLLTNQGGQNTDLKTVTASNLYLGADANHNSRFMVNSSTNLDGVGHLYFDGGQLWLDQAGLTYSGDVTFLTTTYTESNTFGKAAMRVHHDGTFSGAVEVQDTAKLAWGVAGKMIEFSGDLTGNGNIELCSYNNTTGTFRISGDTSGYHGAILSDAPITLALADGKELTINSGSDIKGAVTLGTGSSLTVTGDGDSSISGIISGNGGIVKDGDGTLTLSGTNTYTGTTEVKAGKLVVEGSIASEIIMGENASIENKGTGAITLSDIDEQLTQVENIGSGTLELKNESGTLSVVDLTIAAGSTISFHDKADTPAEGTITVTETLTAGGGKLLANLVLEDGAMLDLCGAGENALTLGSNLAFVNGGLVTLDDATLAQLDLLDMNSDSNYLVLFKAEEGTTLTYGPDGTANYDGMWFGELFDRPDTLVGDFKVVATGTSFGLTKVSEVPEPATGTLSLLALAALAARRRRR